MHTAYGKDMATLVNRDVVVKDVDGRKVVGRCTGQSVGDNWIKVLLPDGTSLMAHTDDFVRIANAMDAQAAVALRGIEGAMQLLKSDSKEMEHLSIAKGVVQGFIE
jgi:hypothetical protein